MKLAGEQALLRVQVSNYARWHAAPLYETLVSRARAAHLAGATVLWGCYGYVEGGPLIGDHPRATGTERPVVVEFVDEEAKLRAFLESVAALLGTHPARITLERAHVVHYRGGEAP